jgi:YVTN family beta-propeller protein
MICQPEMPTMKQPLLISLVVATSICVGVLTSVADITITNRPAAGGKPITPAGSLVIDITTHQPAVGALPLDFVRSPDNTGPDGLGRYLVAVNSGFGIQFNSATNRAQQSLALIDLNARPAPAVIQNVYFPAPQGVNVGVVFSPRPDADGCYKLYASDGFENKIWVFRFRPGARPVISPPSQGPNTFVEAPFIDVSKFQLVAPSPRYNDGRAPVYPTGLAISPDGDTLFVANNLADNLGIISNLRGTHRLTSVDLRRASRGEQFIYPYGVIALPSRDGSRTEKVYVSCWNDASIAVVDPRRAAVTGRIAVDRHPTAMILNRARTRLYAVNSNADTVSVIDTALDREIERINVRLSEEALIGSSPESLALSADGATLYVANAHSNAVAVVALSEAARGEASAKSDRSRLRGFIPTGQYPSAVAVVGNTIFIGNGKGTGFENSSLVVNNSGYAPNAPNDRFPAGRGRGSGQGGTYIVALIAGNISFLAEPDEAALASYTQQVMRNNGLIGQPRTKLFQGRSPIKHVIYIIKENRTYDQVFGDLERAGNGQRADGDLRLAIFGAGEAARRGEGPPQNITPNHRALALRFGLFDRFFVNSEASPDGHNWSTAAFSNDYVDKAYRWQYSNRGRTYDYEGFNRLPSIDPIKGVAPLFSLPVSAEDVANFQRRFVPYLVGSRDVAEPETLYLWDLAARSGLTYRNYGEFIATISEAMVAAINRNEARTYPDLTPNQAAFATKKSLEDHYNARFRNFDLLTPDAMTTESYKAAQESNGRIDPLISRFNPDERFRGTSRLGEWLEEFRSWVADLEAGRPDPMPNLSIVRLPSDHTAGLRAGMPTPQFYVADNDYALGRLVEAVSNSPYWKDTAIFVVEDDAQDGPDHVDAHRSPALIISAYNRRGVLIHAFHNTVSLIRTMEMLLGMPPMNQLDAAAVPVAIFQSQADMRPYKAILPEVALDNLITQSARDAMTAYWMKRSAEQDLSHADMADARVLNASIWFSVRGPGQPMPEARRLPAFDLMRDLGRSSSRLLAKR